MMEIFGEMPMPDDLSGSAADYDAYWSDRISNDVTTEPAVRRARGVLDLMTKGDTVLDIGCGTGETLALLRKERAITGTGLDISSLALESVADSGFETILSNLCEKDASLSGEWDHIIMFELLEHVQDAELLMQKVRGHFRKGLYITTPNLGYIAHRLRLLFGRFPVTYMFDPREHLRFWTVRDFLHWSGKLGFDPPDVRGLRGKPGAFSLYRRLPSLFASEVVYLFRKELP